MHTVGLVEKEDAPVAILLQENAKVHLESARRHKDYTAGNALSFEADAERGPQTAIHSFLSDIQSHRRASTFQSVRKRCTASPMPAK